MSVERSEAVVLRAVDFSETSRIVTVLAPDRGRVALLAAGLRRPRSKFAGAIDTLNRVELVYYWKDGRNVQKLAEASLLDGFPAVKADLEKGAYAAIPVECALRIAHENEPSRPLYDTLVASLSELSVWSGPARTWCCWALLGILSAAGFELWLGGGSPGAGASFSYDAGVTEQGERRDRRLSANAIETLRALAQAQDACPNVACSPEVFDVLSGYAERQLDASLRSVRVLHDMFGST